MLLLRPPGVYRPQADTALLARALATAGFPQGSRVLDVGTGTGAIAVAAARAGAGKVTAVDISWRAVAAARLNTAARRLPVQVQRGDLLDGVAGRRYDVILANPPYVPSERPSPPAGVRAGLARHRRSRAWDAGPQGRALLDQLCTDAPDLLAPGGMILLVHSAVCGVDTTLEALRQAGLTAAVVARHFEPFGPVMRRRRGFLQRGGLVEPNQWHEELVVVRADRPVEAVGFAQPRPRRSRATASSSTSSRLQNAHRTRGRPTSTWS